jgi:AraC-like DNA-binding protein
MLKKKAGIFGVFSINDEHYQAQRVQFDELCQWIDLHLDEQLGWQELMAHTGWDYQTIQTLFYRHKCTTAMTWIRLRRQMHNSVTDMLPHRLQLPESSQSHP